MRILRVAPDIYPYVVGGYGLHIHDLSSEQGKKGHYVEVYIISRDVKSRNQLYYSIKKFREIVRIWGNPISLTYAFKLARNWDNFDIVHAHSHLFLTTLLAAILRKFNKTPLIITNHGLVSQTAPVWINNIYNRIFGRYIFASADYIIVYTSKEKEKLVMWGISPDKIKVIFNGVDTRVFKNNMELRKKKDFIWVGRLVPGKRPILALTVFNKLKEKYPNLESNFVMIGDGPLKDEVVQFIEESQFKENIVYHSYIPNEKLPDYYSQSLVFLLTSTTEGLPRTLLEAFSCETPAVISKIPHLDEVMDRAGIMVTNSSVDDFLEKIEHLIQNPKFLRKMGYMGRQKVEKHYSWEVFVVKNLELYEKLRREL